MPSIYVACLASYNDGKLYGKWIEISSSKDEMLEEIEQMLKGSPMGEQAEEWAIHDTEDLQGFDVGSEPSLDELVKVASLIDEFNDQHIAEAMFQFVDGDSDDLERAKENFAGTFEDPEDWAVQYLDDTGALSELPEQLKYYFDYEKFAEDCQRGGDMQFIDNCGGCFAFHNH